MGLSGERRWAGHTAFVTGGASGIGAALCRAVAAAGASVAVADRDGARAQDLARSLVDEGGTAIAVELDVGDPEAWVEAARTVEAAIGPVSILCNNAGVGAAVGPIEATDPAMWREVQTVNVNAIFYSLRTFLPGMKARGTPAHIVNTSSMAALVPAASLGAYVTSKFASLGLSWVLARELADTAISVSVLCPGNVDTRLAFTAAEQQARVTGQPMEPPDAAISAVMTKGMRPDSVAAAVLRGLEERRFLILTHPDWEPHVRAMCNAVLESFGDSAQPGFVDEFLPMIAV